MDLVNHWPIISFLISGLVFGSVFYGFTKKTISTLTEEIHALKKDLSDMRAEMKHMVHIDFCRHERSDCNQIRADQHCAIQSKIQEMMAMLIGMERKREDTKDKNQEIFAGFAAQIAGLAAEVKMVLSEVRK